MKRAIAALFVLALVATGCTRGRSAPVTPTPTGPKRPPSVEILGQNLRVPNAADEAVRFGFGPDDPSLRVIVTFEDDSAIVAVCGLASVDAPLPAVGAPECLSEVPSGVSEQIVRSKGLGGLAIWVRSGPEVIADVRVEFAEKHRRMTVRLPLVPSPPDPRSCKDNACNPFFEVRPVRAGSFSATATWSGGAARFALLEGPILGRSFTATGLPYAVPDEDTGESPATLSARLSSPAEYAIVLQHLPSGGPDLTAISIEASWP